MYLCDGELILRILCDDYPRGVEDIDVARLVASANQREPPLVSSIVTMSQDCL